MVLMNTIIYAIVYIMNNNIWLYVFHIKILFESLTWQQRFMAAPGVQKIWSSGFEICDLVSVDRSNYQKTLTKLSQRKLLPNFPRPLPNL